MHDVSYLMCYTCNMCDVTYEIFCKVCGVFSDVMLLI